MNAEYFLFGIAFLWTLFASIQDLKTREVANWLSFSLIFIGLFYKIVYSIFSNDYIYLGYSLISFAMFTGLAYAFYYGKVFAGGDAKLLMGIGTIIPGVSLSDTLLNGILFVFALFLLGSIWSIFVLFTNLVPITRKRFLQEFKKYRRYYSYLIGVSALLTFIFFLILPFSLAVTLSIIVVCTLLGYPLLKTADKCMIMQISPKLLTEGDWITKDIRVGNKVIYKTVHGLSIKDINLLKKAGKSVEMKVGVPFVPAFLFSLISMVFFWTAGLNLSSLLELLAQVS